MKVAFHFACSHINQGYDIQFYDLIFKKLLALKEPFVSTKILIGDLLHHDLLQKADHPDDFMAYLFQLHGETWKRIEIDKLDNFIKSDVFVICFETIQREVADRLHHALTAEEWYLGAFEIDHSVELHWWLYGACIGPKFRVLNNELHILIDADDVENNEYGDSLTSDLKSIPFESISKELSNYRYSILDDKHNFENARRTAEWKKSTESLFSTITDEIIAKLTDTAPDLMDKLWAINEAFTKAQAGEQYAQAMTSCRRVFEYVTDCLFPATDEIIDGHSLKKDKYKNRLIEFSRRELRSDTNIDLIVTNTASLFEEWAKLHELSNKGVHSEPHRLECRRCILRTILLLDDLIAIKRTAFPVNIKSEKFINGYLDRFREQP